MMVFPLLVYVDLDIDKITDYSVQHSIWHLINYLAITPNSKASLTDTSPHLELA